MTYWWNNDDFSFDKDVDINVDANLDVNVTSDPVFDTSVDVDVCVNIDPDIDGNTAVFAVDVEAVGDDGYTELSLFVLTTDDLSMITATGMSITG